MTKLADEGLGVGDAEQPQRDRSGPDLGGLGRRVLEVESNSVLIATLALVLFIGVLHPNFLAWGQLKEIAQNAAYVGIIAGGMAFLISMREIDLSVGSMFGLLSAVNSGLAYFNVPVNWSSFATGAVILAAVALDSLIRGRRRHRRTGLDL